MRFTSPVFGVYVGVVLVAYYAVPRRWQWVALLSASMVFYLPNGVRPLLLILLTAATTYATARIVEKIQETHPGKAAKRRGKSWITLYLLLNLSILGVCKVRYTTQSILLPMGISFYLFQSIGYVLDVYRGRIRAEKNPLHLLLFVAYFPQLVQGPISKYQELMPRLLAQHPYQGKQVSRGLQRMLWGYFKKLVIADRIAVAVSALRSPQYTGLSFLVLTCFYAIQIYGDFTGGMDIALGLSEALGIQLPENFLHPFFSTSTAEYWRRWHITLGAWMKDYIFYPVSVSAPMRRLSKMLRKKHPRLGKRSPVYAACIVTWLCTGIWHGITPNFLLWGMMNCGVIVLSQELMPVYEAFHQRYHLNEKRWYKYFQVLRMFLLMNLIRIVDLFPDVGAYFRRLGTMFSSFHVPLGELGLSGLDYGILLGGTALMLSVSLIQKHLGSIRDLLRERNGLRYVLVAGLFLAVLLMGRYGIGYDAGNFIYNQF